MVTSLKSRLDESERALVDVTHARIRKLLPPGLITGDDVHFRNPTMATTWVMAVLLVARRSRVSVFAANVVDNWSIDCVLISSVFCSHGSASS